MGDHPSYEPPKLSKIVITDGWATVDGVKIARFVAERGVLQFVDKDRRRSSARGSRYVEVAVVDMVNLGKEGK